MLTFSIIRLLKETSFFKYFHMGSDICCSGIISEDFLGIKGGSYVEILYNKESFYGIKYTVGNKYNNGNLKSNFTSPFDCMFDLPSSVDQLNYEKEYYNRWWLEDDNNEYCGKLLFKVVPQIENEKFHLKFEIAHDDV